MAIPLPGAIQYEYKQITVAKDDATVNTEIETQGNDNWFLVMWQLDGSSMILLFGRITSVVPT